MSLRSRLLRSAPPFATLAVLFVAWQVLVGKADLPSYLLPSPSMVADRFYGGIVLGQMMPNLIWTIVIALAGYLVAAIVAVALAAVLSESRVLEALAFPLISGFQAIPKVAIAPLVLIWADYGKASEVILVALIAFFPIFNGALIGFKSVDIRLIDLLRTCEASRWFKFWHLSLPAASGQILAGLQIAVGFSLVGCVVVEFLIGTGGIGFLIQNSANTLDTASGVAAMVLLAVIGAVAGMSVEALRHRLIFWEAVDGNSMRKSIAGP